MTADPEIPVPPLGYGGIERIVAGLIRELRRRGHVVGLVAHADSSEAVDHCTPWPGRQSQRLRDTWANLRALHGAVRAFQPDVVHSFSRLAYLLPLLRGRIPLLMSYQRNPSLRTTRWAQRLAGPRLQFTGCSAHIAALGRRAGGTWHAIANFVDVPSMPWTAQVAAEAPLLFLSRVERIKGAHTAIAVARAAGRRLLIAGNVPADAASRQYFDGYIQPHLRPGVVEYLGEVDDTQKRELLPQAAALLVPIEWEEPFGIVFAEALACGTPVLSCARGALPEIIDDPALGCLSADIDLLAEAARHPQRFDRVACRAAALARFDAPVVADRYLQCYVDLLASAR